jgi:Holliday junction resolvasome RuvABC endonuclease subunit
MNVIGLDLSVRASGVCFGDLTAVVVVPRTTGDARFVEIPDRIIGYCRAGEAQLAVIEKAPPGLKGHADLIYGVQAVVRAALIREGIPYVELSPGTVKKFATGSGTADKTAMAMAAYKRAGLEFPDDNACDAWWLRLAGLWAMGHAFIDMPKANCEGLRKVAWPDLEKEAAA